MFDPLNLVVVLPNISDLVSLTETDITVGQYNYAGQPGQNISQISDGSGQ